MGIHGGVSQIPSDETAPYQPGDEYQRAKLAAEERVWDWYRTTQLPTTVVRPAGIYGPGDLRFLKLFRGVQRGYFTVLGSGETWFHPVYVDDLILGLLHCGTEARAIGEAFCISSSRSVTINELVRLIADAVGVHAPWWHLPVWPFYAAGALCELVCVPLGINPPIYRRRVEFFTHNRAWTSEKARRLLGYAWQVDHEEGFRRTAQWYGANGYLRPRTGDVSHQA
jgi:nucleoside-diphosphate-sugar epimerase